MASCGSQPKKLLMTEEQRTTLKAWVGAKTSPQRTVLRARICLLAADGLSNRSIAQNLKTTRPTVVQWRKRFENEGLRDWRKMHL